MGGRVGQPRSGLAGDFTLQREQLALAVAEECHPQATRRQWGHEELFALEPRDTPERRTVSGGEAERSVLLNAASIEYAGTPGPPGGPRVT